MQAQILDLINGLQQSLGMAVILITHDLGVIASTCDRVLVMYAGTILESATVRALFQTPRHPYTEALMASRPSAHAKGETLYTIPGLPPDYTTEITGCPFAERCRFAVDACRERKPVLAEVAPGRQSACLRVQAGEL